MKKPAQRCTSAIAMVLTSIAATTAPAAMALLGSPTFSNSNSNNYNDAHVAFQVRHRLLNEGEPEAADRFDEEGVDELHSLQGEDEDDIFLADENETDDSSGRETEDENRNDDGGTDLNTILSAFESVNVSLPELVVPPEIIAGAGEDAVVAVQPQEKPPDASFFDLTGGSVQFGMCHAPQLYNGATNGATARQQFLVSDRNYPAMATFQMCLGAFAENSSGSNRTTTSHDITSNSC